MSAVTGTRLVAIAGTLDAGSMALVQQEVAAALAAKAERVELDLTGVTRTTPAGADVIAWCVEAARALPGGLGIAVATAAGRAALLASLGRTDAT